MRKLMLVLSLFQLSAFADTNGISLTLYFPHTEMLAGEWFDYSISGNGRAGGQGMPARAGRSTPTSP